jgi:hypothetical protein
MKTETHTEFFRELRALLVKHNVSSLGANAESVAVDSAAIYFNGDNGE